MIVSGPCLLIRSERDLEVIKNQLIRLNLIPSSEKPTLTLRDEDDVHLTNVGLLYQAQNLEDLIDLMSNESDSLRRLTPGDFLGNIHMLHDITQSEFSNVSHHNNSSNKIIVFSLQQKSKILIAKHRRVEREWH